MRRFFAAALAGLLVAGAGVSGCKPRTVELQSGTQVLCTYGEVVSEQIETLVVPQKEAGRYSVRTSTVVCDTHRKLEDLYRRAQEDIAAGDLKAARAKLDEVARLDPAFRNAASQRDALGGGDDPPPAVGPSTPSGTPSGGTTNTPAGPVVNLLKYVPDSIAGYAAQSVVPDVLSVSRIYYPTASGDVVQLVIQAEQFKDAAQASDKIASDVKSAYPSAAATVKVGGRDAYFGTNARGYAVIGTSDGAAMVVFEMYSKSRRPEALRSTLTAVAEAVM